MYASKTSPKTLLTWSERQEDRRLASLRDAEAVVRGTGRIEDRGGDLAGTEDARIGAVSAIGVEARDASTTDRPRTIGSHDGRTQQRGTVAAAPLDDREASFLEDLYHVASAPEAVPLICAFCFLLRSVDGWTMTVAGDPVNSSASEVRTWVPPVSGLRFHTTKM